MNRGDLEENTVKLKSFIFGLHSKKEDLSIMEYSAAMHEVYEFGMKECDLSITEIQRLIDFLISKN